MPLSSLCWVVKFKLQSSRGQGTLTLFSDPESDMIMCTQIFTSNTAGTGHGSRFVVIAIGSYLCILIELFYYYQ